MGIEKATAMEPDVNLSNPISAASAEHYAWGNGCDGWHLLRNSEISIIQESMPPQTAEVPHYHQHSRQFFFVLAGSLAISTPDNLHLLSREQGVEIAPGVPHHVCNTSDNPTSFLVVSSPTSHGDRVVIANVQRKW